MERIVRKLNKEKQVKMKIFRQQKIYIEKHICFILFFKYSIIVFSDKATEDF